MTENVVTQGLRDFTVQIRIANSETIVGTGLVVSSDGRVVTCAHVVKSTGVEPREINGKELGVYFPQASAGEKKNRCAKVIAFFPDSDDDVVLLHLTDGPAPLGPERMPVLGTAEESQGNAFRSYGYRHLEDYVAGWADGKIQGRVEPPFNRKMQSEPVQLESNQINRGMSGSAVLDVERNLVVGIVSEAWFPDKSGKDRDTAWAVDSYVLSLAPLGLTVQHAPLPLKAAPKPKYDVARAKAAISISVKYSWNNAPTVLKEWTGRYELLKQITKDWINPKKHVTGLIGFGGEGKSSLARKWVDNLFNDSSQPQPDGVFWWSFYENRSIDEFLEAALKYMSSGKIDPHRVQSSSLRAQIIGAMLNAGRYLFVLDGLEVMQYQDGDLYGLLINTDLRELLTYFARPDNHSFCLITSRAPLIDLMNYTTYTQRDVDRLSTEDGRALLKTLNVKGNDAELDKVVADWDGHALTLSILAAYLTDQFNGEVKHLADIPLPETTESRYERVHRVLRRYDEHLTKDERELLKLFAVFRSPIRETAFEKVFQPLLRPLSHDAIRELVSQLTTYRIIRFDQQSNTYTTHPLIRNHYSALFMKGNSKQRKIAHEQIKDYYLSIAGDPPQYPTLENLRPLLEVVHHTCQAEAYDEAFSIFWKNIQRGRGENVLDYHLGAYETELALMCEFCPNGDTAQDPRVSKLDSKHFILSEMALCLMNVGYLKRALPVYERDVKIGVEVKDWVNACNSYQNLAELHVRLGELDQAAEVAKEALRVNELVGSVDLHAHNQLFSLSWQGWVASLSGNMELANLSFGKAEPLAREFNVNYIWSNGGIFHADHLRRIGDLNHARQVTEANLKLSDQSHWIDKISQCHRVLGDLDSTSGKRKSALAHYESALKISQGISRRDVLIEALLARGRFFAKQMKDANVAFADLDEALGYCAASGYRIYEADTRVALAWAYLAKHEKQMAKASVERGLQMSNEMGYYWGKADAEELLKEIAN